MSTIKHLHTLDLDEPRQYDALRRRVGRFRIDHYLLKGHATQLLPLFAQMVVVEATSRYHFDAIEYTAMSPLFEELTEGVEAPRYKLNFRNDGNQVTLAEVIRLNEGEF